MNEKLDQRLGHSNLGVQLERLEICFHCDVAGYPETQCGASGETRNTISNDLLFSLQTSHFREMDASSDARVPERDFKNFIAILFARETF